jgi:hypothetical protein
VLQARTKQSRIRKPKLAHTNYLTLNNIGKSVKLMRPMSHPTYAIQDKDKKNKTI